MLLFLHKDLQFAKENARCILHAYGVPQELYRLLHASGFQLPGAYAYAMDLCKHCNVSKQTVTRVVPSSYKVQMRSPFYVSARSSHFVEFKCIVSTYNVVSVKCHKVVCSLNSKADTNLKGSQTLL